MALERSVYLQNLHVAVVTDVLQGYVEAARLFEKESGTPPCVELSAITDRMEIRKAVQSGNIDEAIERVNDLNPEV